MQVVFDVIIKLGMEKREDKLIMWTFLSSSLREAGIRGGWREKAMGGQERKRSEGVKE